MQDSKGRENEKVLGIPVSFPEFLFLQDILSVAEMVARTHLQCFPWPLCCQTWWSIPSLLNLIYHTVFDAGVCCIYFSIFLPWPLKDNTILVFVLPFSLLVPPHHLFFFSKCWRTHFLSLLPLLLLSSLLLSVCKPRVGNDACLEIRTVKWRELYSISACCFGCSQITGHL